jgi:isopentenyldiphosphate isomerase
MPEQVALVDGQDRVLRSVDRTEAIRRGWLHRVAGIVCRDQQGRFLVHRRSGESTWFAGWHAPLVAGAVRAGETYTEAAEREAAEELGVRVAVRSVCKFICQGPIGPYWFGIHEAMVTQDITPDAHEIAWFEWYTEPEFRQAAATQQWRVIPDAEEAFSRYLQERA